MPGHFLTHVRFEVCVREQARHHRLEALTKEGQEHSRDADVVSRLALTGLLAPAHHGQRTGNVANRNLCQKQIQLQG